MGYAVVDIVASTKSELSKISQVKFLSYSYGYSLTDSVHVTHLKILCPSFKVVTQSWFQFPDSSINRGIIC